MVAHGCAISGLSNKFRHAEFISASIQNVALRFRNKFGMTPQGERIRQSHMIKKPRTFTFPATGHGEELRRFVKKPRSLIALRESLNAPQGNRPAMYSCMGLKNFLNVLSHTCMGPIVVF